MRISLEEYCKNHGKRELLQQWDTEKNLPLDPGKVSYGSGKKVWWLCEQKHSWDATVSSRVKGSGCPFCAGRKAIPGSTDLETLCPDLATQWHPTLNGDLRPQHMTCHSNKKVWWRCEKGHPWQATVDKRSRGLTCTVCSGRTILPGYNDLATLRPELAQEWLYEKNNPLLPNHTAPQSNRKVWWRCRLGHIWQATVSDRFSGNDCPFCSHHRILAGFNDLATSDPLLARQWHPSRNGDLTPMQVACNSDKKVWWQCGRGHSWQALIGDRHRGNGCPYCSGRRVVSGVNDLATTHPALVTQWNHEKNGDLTPSDTSAGSNQKVWWRCKLGHSWKAAISNRAKGRNCPYCAGKKVLPGYNDLASQSPDLAAQWHPDKNYGLLPESVTTRSGKRVWWLCERGHAWQATVANRTAGVGCPFCAGKRVLIGFNDLASVDPDLARQWHPSKNGYLTPFHVTSGSSKKIWWLCERGHEWCTTIASRSQGCGCPKCFPSTSFAEQAIYFYCSRFFTAHNRFRYQGRELDVFLPDLSIAIEHDGPLHQREVTKASDSAKDELLSCHNIFLYRVKTGDTFHISPDKRIITYRYAAGNFCNLERALHALFTLISERLGQQLAPDIDLNRDQGAILSLYHHQETEKALFQRTPQAKEYWDYEKNVSLNPDFFSYGSGRLVWWKCERGHSWQCPISGFSSGQRCPYCSGHRIWPGFNDLASCNQRLASQWHPTLNGDLTPEQVTCHSGKRVWWLCEKGHIWSAVIASRSGGQECPYCKKRRGQAATEAC